MHHEDPPAQRINFEGFGALALHRSRDTRLTSASPLGAQEPAALALPAALLLGLALVVKLLAAGERDLDLGAALLVEIELERHERHALTLDGAHQLVDLVP